MSGIGGTGQLSIVWRSSTTEAFTLHVFSYTSADSKINQDDLLFLFLHSNVTGFNIAVVDSVRVQVLKDLQNISDVFNQYRFTRRYSSVSKQAEKTRSLILGLYANDTNAGDNCNEFLALLYATVIDFPECKQLVFKFSSRNNTHSNSFQAEPLDAVMMLVIDLDPMIYTLGSQPILTLVFFGFLKRVDVLNELECKLVYFTIMSKLVECHQYVVFQFFVLFFVVVSYMLLLLFYGSLLSRNIKEALDNINWFKLYLGVVLE